MKAYKTISAAGNWMYSTRWCKRTELGSLTRLPKSGSQPGSGEDFDYYFRIAPQFLDMVAELPEVVNLDVDTAQISDIETGEVLEVGVGA